MVNKQWGLHYILKDVHNVAVYFGFKSVIPQELYLKIVKGVDGLLIGCLMKIIGKKKKHME